MVILFKSAPIGFKWPSYSPGAGVYSKGFGTLCIGYLIIADGEKVFMSLSAILIS